MHADAERMRVVPPPPCAVYRLHVWITDGNGKVATANVPFNATTTQRPVSLPVFGDTYLTDGALIATGASAGSYTAPGYLTHGAEQTMQLQTAANGAAGGSSIPYVQFSTASLPAGVAPASCSLWLWCASGSVPAAVNTYGVGGVKNSPWPEATLNWYLANVTTASNPGYPVGGQLPYASPVTKPTVTIAQCSGNWVSFDVSVFTQNQACPLVRWRTREQRCYPLLVNMLLFAGDSVSVTLC